MQVLRLNSTESTNTYLKALSKDRALVSYAVVSKTQTAGRGSGDRSFFSTEGGLYLSYLFSPGTPPAETCTITKWAAVAVRDAIACLFPELTVQIKPVNDLLINGRKACGILTEYTGGNVIIGVGVNANILSFPEGLNATSLLIESGRKADLPLLEKKVLEELERIREFWPDAKEIYVSEYERHCI